MVNIAITLSLINLVMFAVIVVLVVSARKRYDQLYKQAVSESLKIAERTLNLVTASISGRLGNSLKDWETNFRMTGIISRAISKGVRDVRKN